MTDDTPTFVPGLELAHRFYWEAVRPALDAEFPGLKHSAALIGTGSEVLGFDTPMSTDHHWGPRAMIFLAGPGYQQYRDAITERLRWKLPHHFLGYPTNFSAPDPDDKGVQLLRATESGPVNHRVEVYTIRGFFRSYLEYDISAEIETADWLSFGEQKLRSIVAGEVFHDDLGLDALRSRLTYYPRDVWLYMLASGWQRIGQEEHLMWRAGYAGDELGSMIITGRLAHDAMRLCFLMERQYAPYPKWFGTAFMRLAAGPDLAPILQRALRAETYQERGEALAAAYEYLAARHNALGITEPITATRALFWSRPFQVIWGDRFADAIVAQISDPTVVGIAKCGLIGGIDQFSDSTDLKHSEWRQAVRGLYRSDVG
jgi:hypothetical protein